MNRNGFTIAELIITFGIIGALVLLGLQSYQSIKPNESQMMLQKSYMELTRIVHELINDEDLYPEGIGETDQYFNNTDEKTYKGRTYGGDAKLCRLFGTKLQVKSAGDNSCSASQSEGTGGSYTTTDGVVWMIPVGAFKEVEDYAQYVFFDVNGSEDPNCGEYANSETFTCNNPDRFRVILYYDGRISIHPNDKVTEYYITTKNTNKSYSDVKKIIDEKNAIEAADKEKD